MASPTALSSYISPCDETIRVMGLLANDILPVATLQKVTGLFEDGQFMVVLNDIRNMAYDKIDADLVQFLGTHSIVPDTEDRLLRRIILAYLIAYKQGECSAALYKFKCAYDETVVICKHYRSASRAPSWKVKLLATE